MINEHKKNRRAVKYNIKPRNFVAKNATTSGAGEHKDKSKELPRRAKHKNKEMDMAEGPELKKAKRAYNQAAKDANADQVGAGKKIDTMKNSLRQKDLNKQGMAEGLLKEDIMGAPRPEDNHEASMALSELYRNAKYGMALLKIIEPNDAIDGWVQANLTTAAEILDKVGHYLDYKNINGRKPEVDMEEDDNVDDAEPGEADGSMARENLEMIVEYSIKLMEMIKPGDNLASWVSMKLTKASEAVSSAKHFIEYRNFEKHASDAFEGKITRMLAQKLSETMSPASTFVGSKKNKLGSAGQLKGNMKRSARAGDLVGSTDESVESNTEQKNTQAKTWDEMSSKEKLSGVKGRTVWNPKTQKYRTVFDVPSQNKK